jgi:hypothetical protein
VKNGPLVRLKSYKEKKINPVGAMRLFLRKVLPQSVLNLLYDKTTCESAQLFT